MSVPKSPRCPPSHPMSSPSPSPPRWPRPHPWMCSCWPGQGNREAQRQHLSADQVDFCHFGLGVQGCTPWGPVAAAGREGLAGWGQLGSALVQGLKHFHPCRITTAAQSQEAAGKEAKDQKNMGKGGSRTKLLRGKGHPQDFAAWPPCPVPCLVSQSTGLCAQWDAQTHRHSSREHLEPAQHS